MQFDAIICDLDGTLIDSLDDLADAMNIVLRRNGFPEHPTDRYRYFIGNGFGPLVRRALPEDRRNPEMVETCVAALDVEYAARRIKKTRPYPGISELLDGCAAAGLKMAILTNKPDGPARDMVFRLMPDTPFVRVWGARPEFPQKPDPAGALCMAQQLGVRPERCIFLGDSAVDMETARRSGMYGVGALWGFRTGDELLDAGARMLVGRPSDLLPWL